MGLTALYRSPQTPNPISIPQSHADGSRGPAEGSKEDRDGEPAAKNTALGQLRMEVVGLQRDINAFLTNQMQGTAEKMDEHVSEEDEDE